MLALTLVFIGAAPVNLEIQVIPVSVQLNSTLHQHVGSGVRMAWEFKPGFGVYVGSLWNWIAEPSPDTAMLRELARVERVASSSTALSTWQGFVGVALTPLRGTFRLSSNYEGGVALEIAGGAGLSGSRVRLADSWGDAGLRVAAHSTLTLRFEFGAFALHLGVRLTLWDSRIARIDGCTRSDWHAFAEAAATARTAFASCSTPQPAFGDSVAGAFILDTTQGGLITNAAAEAGVSWRF